jgi:hypothetical protein
VVLRAMKLFPRVRSGLRSVGTARALPATDVTTLPSGMRIASQVFVYLSFLLILFLSFLFF